MHDRPRTHGKALSLLIVWLIALSGALALLAAFPGPAHAATCDQGGSLISGDWTITTAQVCSGIVYTVDGTITINSGGSLSLVNGGLSFAKDELHTGYSLTVNAGGSLSLDHSTVTVQTTMIKPYLKLAFTVTGAGSSFSMTDGSTLMFPGWFNASSATISMTDSTITGFSPASLYNVGVYVGDNDNAPLIAWSATTASLYHSSIARLYENTTASTATNITGPIEGNVSLTGGSSLYAYDSYISADYSNVLGLHNEIQVDATSNAYLYNVTIDRSEDPFLETSWQPAFRPLAAGGTVYLFHWLRATIVDSTSFPISGASIWATLSPAATTAQYPDNSLGTTPSARTLAYLGTSSGTWNVTNANGQVVIPLYTDSITTASLPNANSFGNYALTLAFQTATASSGVNFSPYPAVDWQHNNAWMTIPMSNVQVRTGPDLALHPSDYPGTLQVLVGQPFTTYALVYNQGQTGATNVPLSAFLDGNRSDAHAYATIATLNAGASVNLTLTVSAISKTGAHKLELVVNPNGTINEGGALQMSNDFANISLNVLPPPQGFIAIGSPSQGASITPGTNLVVSGVVRDTTSAANPIPGVGVTISLMSGSSTITSANAITDTSGAFLVSLAVPAGAAAGSYTVTVTSTATTISPDSRTITVVAPASFLNSLVPLLNVPWWLFLIILAAVLVIAIGVTAYFKVYGIGKMVECGECGSFIPQDAVRCPKCGVEFEKDMAKCSNCGSWIPFDVKECPECGVKFATGELDMASYQERMRLQYDDVVAKLRTDASRQLGRQLSEAEFQEWWRRQPSFVTFEDWLHEEEDMRKQGSKACPVCGTLNSVTAKVCHKCGSLMRSTAAGPAGTVTVGAPRRPGRTVTPSEPSEDTGGTAPPRTNGPVVQKKIVKKGPTEPGTSEGGDQLDDNQGL